MRVMGDGWVGGGGGKGRVNMNLKWSNCDGLIQQIWFCFGMLSSADEAVDPQRNPSSFRRHPHRMGKNQALVIIWAIKSKSINQSINQSINELKWNVKQKPTVKLIT